MGRLKPAVAPIHVAAVGLAVMLLSSCAIPVLSTSSATGGGGASTPIAVSVGAGSTRATRSPSTCPLPTGSDAFGTAAPEDVDLDSGPVNSAVFLATLNLAESVRIYRRDCLVATSGRDAETATIPQNLWSATKGILSILVGRAVTQGRLRLDDPIGSYLPEADAAHGALTVRNLLTQNSGLRFAWANDVAAGADRDSVEYTLGLPFDHEPGTYFEYAQTTLTTLGAVVEAAVGRDLQEYARDELFRPLGIPDTRWSWMRDGAGHTLGYAALSMAPLDLARIGELLLHRGAWGGQQIIDAGYVDQMSEPTGTNPGYGLLVWTNRGDRFFTSSSLVRKERDHAWLESAPRDLYGLSGLFDQYVYIIPSLDMVVVRTGFMGFSGWAHEFFRTMLKGLRDTSVPDPGPAPVEDQVDLSNLDRLIDFRTFPVSDPIR